MKGDRPAARPIYSDWQHRTRSLARVARTRLRGVAHANDTRGDVQININRINPGAMSSEANSHKAIARSPAAPAPLVSVRDNDSTSSRQMNEVHKQNMCVHANDDHLARAPSEMGVGIVSFRPNSLEVVNQNSLKYNARKLCRCEVSHESVSQWRKMGSRREKVVSGRVIPAHCIICRQFRAYTARNPRTGLRRVELQTSDSRKLCLPSRKLIRSKGMKEGRRVGVGVLITLTQRDDYLEYFRNLHGNPRHRFTLSIPTASRGQKLVFKKKVFERSTPLRIQVISHPPYVIDDVIGPRALVERDADTSTCSSVVTSGHIFLIAGATQTRRSLHVAPHGIPTGHDRTMRAPRRCRCSKRPAARTLFYKYTKTQPARAASIRGGGGGLYTVVDVKRIERWGCGGGAGFASRQADVPGVDRRRCRPPLARYPRPGRPLPPLRAACCFNAPAVDRIIVTHAGASQA
ncbi:hypothetical protein EVAR_17668_1 [Eumeta japonica]|uniref:Uncharacterized protein n=1 Tax=Eumeta variegata TaxID=151549 RepID=A0A4C1URP1_EUMVA|nr:hypothetical protein EVAR_17668_1 [Eumeta japonica]